MKSIIPVCLLLSCLALCSACATSTLTVNHQDPTAPVARVWVDGQLRGTVIYGESMTVDVKPGRRVVLASTPQSKSNAWRASKRPWHIIVDEQCTMTLLTPKVRRKSNGSK